MADHLPIDEALPALKAALAQNSNAVLVAPPGAGKTTRAPLALTDEAWAQTGKIIMLEPRRLAARAAAHRMAQSLNEKVGETIGFRVRAETRVSAKTRIEVVTEGVFTRLILDDPELSGVCAVLFDEQHERSLESDLALALALDAQAGLRPDLRILPMSATIDGARVARLLGDAPVIESQGRAFPVETRYRGRDPQRRIEDEITDAILAALRAEDGSILVFLPGAGEIRRVQERLHERLTDANVIVAPLYGALDFKAQDLAISPAPSGKRKVVLATSIAETSLTIDGVRVVIDSGLSRRPRFDPASGLTALETVRVSRAAADQRRGRAGRTAPGICWRLWDEPQTRSLLALDKPEILDADLTGLALDLARWGARPESLQWLDAPPAGAYAEALSLLRGLHALDAEYRITPHGAELADIPLPPRLAHLVIEGAERGMGLSAARVAALLSERGIGGDDPDARHRLDRMSKGQTPKDREARELADRYAKLAGVKSDTQNVDVGALIALAFPERVAQSRDSLARGKPGAFVTVSGRGAAVAPETALAREPFLAIAEMQGAAQEARITLAAPISRSMIETLFAQDIETSEDAGFDPQTRSVRSKRISRLGRVILSEGPGAKLDPDAAARALAEGVQQLGWTAMPGAEAFAAMRARMTFLHTHLPDAWPDVSDDALRNRAEDWLMPPLAGKTRIDDLSENMLSEALLNLLAWDQRGALDRLAPSHFATPAGTHRPIDYAATGGPSLGVRVQEMFGLATHPAVLDGRVPLTVELLSPAYRPVQTTKDLPGFWRGSYSAVRTEMRGRYPKHPWPEDPLSADPTTRAKPRGT